MRVTGGLVSFSFLASVWVALACLRACLQCVWVCAVCVPCVCESLCVFACLHARDMLVFLGCVVFTPPPLHLPFGFWMQLFVALRALLRSQFDDPSPSPVAVGDAVVELNGIALAVLRAAFDYRKKNEEAYRVAATGGSDGETSCTLSPPPHTLYFPSFPSTYRRRAFHASQGTNKPWPCLPLMVTPSFPASLGGWG
jgi:hypothetical protein